MSAIVPGDVYREWVKSGDDWADKLGAAELLEHSLKSLRAQITVNAKHTEGCSMAEAEQIALSCSDYRDACQGAVEARREANRARVRYDATKALFEARRTEAATERATLRAAP
jgi:hypothetical protein